VAFVAISRQCDALACRRPQPLPFILTVVAARNLQRRRTVSGVHANGHAQTGTFYDGGASRCRANYPDWCVKLEWEAGLFPYSPGARVPEHWHGTLIGEKRDASGLLYRRNRYYDPATGRFTQEDPIGLAGGINVYGFAEGDPVTYSDPYGLCPEWLTGKPCNGWIATLVGLLLGIGNGSDAVSLARGRDVMTGERITGTDALYTVVGALFASGRFGRTAGRQAEDLFGRVIEFVGDDARAFLNEAGDLVVQSADELREIRFDMRRPHPHQSSHVHVIHV
jgi:RHS repeat-associated protein